MDDKTGKDLVCVTGEEFRKEVALWDEDYILGRVYRAWDAIRDTHWTDDQLDKLDNEIVPYVFVVSVDAGYCFAEI